MQREEWNSLIFQGLFCKQNVNLRKFFAIGLYFLVIFESKQELPFFLLNNLLNNLPESDKTVRYNFMSFYDLLCKILEQSSFLLTAE